MSSKYLSSVTFNIKHWKTKIFKDSIHLGKTFQYRLISQSRYYNDDFASKNSKEQDEISQNSKKRGLENKKFMDMRLNEMRSFSSKNWYPHKFDYTMTVPEFVNKFSNIDTSDQFANHTYRLCGRVNKIRKHGKKLSFIDINQNEGIVQIKASADAYNGDFKNDMMTLKRGDIIGVEGSPTVTKSGELTLLLTTMSLLAPTLKIIPSQAVVDIELRYRKRHLDLLTNFESRSIFRTRARILSHIRSYLDKRDFIEVETPILTDGIGGASAAAFDTYHNDLGMKMSLRIAPELHLKSLIVGGFDRVYEIGKQFRNEGIDSTHNPEFTSCEFYMAYADYKDLLELTESLLCETAGSLQGISSSDFEANESLHNAFIKKSYKRIEFIPTLELATGTEFPNPSDLVDDSDEAVKFLFSLCQKADIEVSEKTTSKLLDKLFSKLVEPELKLPTFVLHHPTCMCPLAKEHRAFKGISERFELFAGGMELVNAYTELNDPVEQQKQFKAQKQSKISETEDSNIEKEFIDALEYGLPPTAGWGLGVDRLVMLLTNQTTIRDVLLFPTMRRKSSEYE